ncbi:MAG: diaminopimelate epimerase [Armatimonadetes bacterium]|nr:diaminopimelate epimerase [Armatimonadota bacterium]MDW8121505.1 diaminopimelate epimerase [Armatimonadota bacterium]
MQGLGNDFVVIDGRRSLPVDPETIATLSVPWCDRHFGIGADGILLILPSDAADARMRIFNADGSEAESCGNGIRCVARVLAQEKGDRQGVVTIETLAGHQRVMYEKDGKGRFSFTVDMGPPILEPARIPTTLGNSSTALNVCLTVTGLGAFVGHCVSMGNPHFVVFTDSVGDLPLEVIGPALERHPAFPKRTNVEFAQVVSRNQLRVRVWERGAGPTLACGTGACATVVAAILTRRTGPQVTVALPGGELIIHWEGEGSVLMTGPAEEVFRGEIAVGKL